MQKKSKPLIKSDSNWWNVIPILIGIVAFAFALIIFLGPSGISKFWGWNYNIAIVFRKIFIVIVGFLELGFAGFLFKMYMSIFVGWTKGESYSSFWRLAEWIFLSVIFVGSIAGFGYFGIYKLLSLIFADQSFWWGQWHYRH